MSEAIHKPPLPLTGDSRKLRSVVVIVDEQVARGERRLTELGKRMLESRRRIERSDIRLLDRCELDSERAERRGGIPNQ